MEGKSKIESLECKSAIREVDILIQASSALKAKLNAIVTKVDIVNSITELSAISQENAASNEEVNASVFEIAESIDKISEDTKMAKEVSADLEELIKYFK